MLDPRTAAIGQSLGLPVSTLQELTTRALQRDGAQAVEHDWRWYSWGEIRQLADQMAALIAASGAAPGAPVGFIPRNRPSAVAALLGMIADGRSIRMLDASQAPAALASNVRRQRPAVLVAAPQDLSEVVLAAAEAEGVAVIAIEEMESWAFPGLERVRSAAAQTDICAAPQIEVTSGTTGPPNQFPISYEVIFRHLAGSLMADWDSSDLSHLPPILLFFPLGDISSVYSALPALLRGRRAVLLERFTVEGWCDHVMRYRPAASGLSPAGVQMVLDANVPCEDLASIRAIGTWAAPLDPTVHRAFEARYGIPILLSYGATEFAGPVAAMTLELHRQFGEAKFGSLGRAIDGARLRIVDPQSGEVLSPGEEGLLEVVSPRIGPDWIRTPDIAVIDEEGFLFHRGRADRAIIRGGFRLSTNGCAGA